METSQVSKAVVTSTVQELQHEVLTSSLQMNVKQCIIVQETRSKLSQALIVVVLYV